MIPKPTDPTPTDLEPTGGRRWAFFLTPIARVGIATLAAVCITVLTGCRGSSAPAPEAALPRAAPASTAPPTIRVRLTAPKTTAKIGTTGAYRIEVDGRRVAASDELMALTEATRRSKAIARRDKLETAGAFHLSPARGNTWSRKCRGPARASSKSISQKPMPSWW